MKLIPALFSLLLICSSSANAHGWVPRECSVQSWCLDRVTECFVGHMTRPQGQHVAHSQYSIVRKVVVLCEIAYGRSERRELTGPVEPIPFASAPNAGDDLARKEALELCRAYRQDYVSAAPRCEDRCSR